MRSRYYSPKVKRFLTLDSELGDVYGPTSKLAKSLKYAPYITIGIDTISGIFENINNDETVKETLTDAVIDVGLGALIGFGSYLATEVIEFNGKSIVEWFDAWL